MLSSEEKREIAEEFGQYEQKSAVCIDALRIVQRHRGWISDEAIRDVAGYLGMSAEEVDGIATFYNLIFRKPVGEHVLFVCDSVSCWVMGCERIKKELRQTIGVGVGETSADGFLTVLPIACLGACDRAPVVLLDGETVTEADPERIASALESLRVPRRAA